MKQWQFRGAEREGLTTLRSVQAECRILLRILEGMICSLQLAGVRTQISFASLRKGVLGPLVPEVKKLPDGSFFKMAEREGFEPSVESPLRSLSKGVLSTTQPSFR